jgi:diacylglycerol kinase family enzyme
MANMFIDMFVGGPMPLKKKQDDMSPHFSKSAETPRIGVLINPLSGNNRNGLDTIRKIIADFPRGLQRDVQTPEDIRSALEYFARKNVNLVAVCGGDGTVQAVLTALFRYRHFESLPLLALLQGGTANMLSKDLGLRGSRKKALRRLMHWSMSGDDKAYIQQRPVLRVSTAGNQEPLYGLFFGAGAIYQGIRFFHEKVKTWGLRGELAHLLILGRYLAALATKSRNVVNPIPINIAWDQHQSKPEDYLLVLISTLERVILGLRPCWGTEDGPLQFTAVGSRPRHLLPTIFQLVFKRDNRYPKSKNGYISHNVHKVQLDLQSGFTLDGELYFPDPRLGPVVVEEGGQASFLRL